jgi:glycerol-3-phosphate dehydrogenase
MIKTFRIFGAGEWGLAVANHLSCLNNQVEVFLRDDNKVNEYNESLFYKGLNLSFNKNIIFRKLTDLNHLSSNGDNFNIIASSSSGFTDIISTYNIYFKSCESIIWLTKGLDHSKGLLFHEIIDKVLSPNIKKCIISGPSFAKDLVATKPLRVSIASTCEILANSMIKIMETKNLKFEKTSDIIGVEISGVIKNISGILAGALTANLYPDEYIEELISLSQKDVKNISRKIAGSQSSYIVTEEQLEKTVLSPACYGDIYLTCYFNASRNRQLGLKIIGKYNIKKIIAKIGTVEGYLSTSTLNTHKEIFGESKIVQVAYKILYLDAEPKTILNQLFN